MRCVSLIFHVDYLLSNNCVIYFKGNSKRGYIIQIICCVWQGYFVLPDCDTAISQGLSFCSSHVVKVHPFSWSTSPSFYTFFQPTSPPFSLSSVTQFSDLTPSGRKLNLFFLSSEWPQQTLTRTFHWHQLPKTINMLCSVSLTFPIVNQTPVPLTYSTQWITFHQQFNHCAVMWFADGLKQYYANTLP